MMGRGVYRYTKKEELRHAFTISRNVIVLH
jgi:hypothetical protein